MFSLIDIKFHLILQLQKIYIVFITQNNSTTTHLNGIYLPTNIYDYDVSLINYNIM